MADGYTYDVLINSLSAFSSSSELVDITLTGESQVIRPKINYGIFSKHSFFGDAVRRFNVGKSRILEEYPIGRFNSDVLSLCAVNIYAVDKFIKESTGFEKWLLEELSRGDADSKTYSVTAGAVNDSGEIVPLIWIDRDISNNIQGVQGSLLNVIENRVNLYENENKQVVDIDSGTAQYYSFNLGSYERQDIIYNGTVTADITRGANINELLPPVLFDDDNEDNLANLLAVFSEILDDLKVYAENVPNIKRVSYDEYEVIPDQFLPVVAREYGINLFDGGKIFDITKNLINSSASGYTSQRITYDLWRRIVYNLMYLLKSKGTKECLEAISRLYGLDSSFIKINEFSNFNKPVSVRDEEELYVPALYSDGTNYVETTVGVTNTSSLLFDFASSQDFTVQARVSLTSGTEHTIIQHPLYSLKINNEAQLTFESVTTPTVTTTTPKSSLSSFMNQEGNFVNVNASRSGDTLSVFLTALSGSPTGGNDIVASATSSYTDVTVGSESYDSVGGTVGGATQFPKSASFDGYIHQVRTWDKALLEEDIIEHTKNFESTSITNSLTANTPVSFDNLKSHFKLKENLVLQNNYNFISNSVYEAATASPIGFGVDNNYTVFKQKRITKSFPIGLAPDNDRIRQEDLSENQKDTGYISFSFNPINSVNRLIKNYVENINLYDLLGEPLDHRSSKYSSGMVLKWQELTSKWGLSLEKQADADDLIDKLFKSGGGDSGDPNTVGVTGVTEGIANYNNFIKAMGNFDDVFGGMFKFSKQFLPAKVNLLGEGVFIESHMFERNKIPRRFGYRKPSISNIDEHTFTADGNIISYDDYREDNNAVPSVSVISTLDKAINNHFLAGDLSVTGSLSANYTDLAASAATTAIFQGFQYKDNNVQDFFDNNTAVNLIPKLTKQSTINEPSFSQARYGRFLPVRVTPAAPEQTEIEITLDQYIIAATASPTSQRGFISGRVRMISNGLDFKTDVSAMSFEFPASADGTNLFVAEVGDIDAGKGRIVKEKDISLTIPLESNNIQFILKLNDVVTSLTAVAGSVTQEMVDDSATGSLGIVPIKITNLFNNKSYIFRVAINSDSTKDTDFIRQISETGIEKVTT